MRINEKEEGIIKMEQDKFYYLFATENAYFKNIYSFALSFSWLLGKKFVTVPQILSNFL